MSKLTIVRASLLAAALATAAAAQDAVPPEAAPQSQTPVPAEDADVRRFYIGREGQAVWDVAAAAALREALEHDAPRNGLRPETFLAMIPPSEDPAERDAGLTRAALAYAGALTRGLVDPESLHQIFSLKGHATDLVPGLAKALERGEVHGWLASLPPQDFVYQTLSRAYLRAIADPRAGQIPAGPIVKPGQADARLPAIAEALAARGYLETPGAPQTLDPPLIEALTRFQTDAGLKPDGRVGPATLKALAEGSADRAVQLAVNMERRRWLTREPPATRIDVNLALANLAYFEDEKTQWFGRVVVGEPKRATPMLEESFSQLVVNPPWVVPTRIAREEILPHGAGYLRRNNMVLVNGQVIQRPSPQTALGLVKFDMQNPYAIYLHDTPAKGLFAARARHRSHGCVRVEKAVEFARFLAQRYGAGEAFETALASGETRAVELSAPIPVRLLYHSAVVYQDGRVLFGPDPYGWDARLAQAMGLTGRPASAEAVQPAAAEDLGP